MKYTPMFLSRKFIWIPAMGFALAGCTGSSSTSGAGRNGGTVEALSLPPDLSVIHFDDDTPAGALVSRAIGANLPANSPELNLDHEAVGPLQTVDMILCMLKHFKYEEHMKTGDECDGDAGYGVKMGLSQCQSSGGNSDAGSDVKVITVKSCRRDADAPHTVKVSFDMEGGRLFAEATIYAAPASSDSATSGYFGKFILAWKHSSGQSQGALWTVADTNGVIDAEGNAQNGWRFREEMGDDSSSAALVVDAGKRYASVSSRRGDDSETYSVSEYGNYFKIGDTVIEQCFDKTQFTEEIWSYDVWKKVENENTYTWEEVTPPKASVQFQSASGCYGNLNRYGVYVDQRCSLDDGAQVKESLPGNNGRTLTYVKKIGKLEQKTPRSVALSDLHGRLFETWSNNYTLSGSTLTLAVNNGQGDQLNLQVKYIADGFYAVKAAHQTNNGNPSWVDVDDVPITGQLNMYDVSNNSDASYDGSSLTLTTYDRRTINPGELSNYAIEGVVDFVDFDNSSNTYTFNVNDYMLLNGTEEMVGNASDNNYRRLKLNHATGDSANLIFEWHDGWGNDGQSNTRKEMSWENFQGLKEGSAYVTVEDPLMFNYSIDVSDLRSESASASAGDRVDFQYVGPGQLWGIQGSQDNQGRWHPNFSLKDGVIVQGSDNAEYAVYATRGSRLMTPQLDNNSDALVACTAMGNGSAPAAPTHLPSISPSEFTDAPVSVEAPTILEDWTVVTP